MASTCSPKLLQISSVVKCASSKPLIHPVVLPSRSVFLGALSGLVISPGSHLPQRGGGSSRSHVNQRDIRACMCSWLRSSRVLFVSGDGGDNNKGGNGSGGDSEFPNNVRRLRNGKDLGETSILRQEGHNIEEVPAAVLRSDSSEKPRKGPPRTYIDLDPREEAAFVEGFSKFHTPQQLLKMLDTIPSQEVTPFVSFSILKKLFELENNFGFRNKGQSWLQMMDNSTTETFTRLAIVTRLIDTILTCENTSILLDTLDLLRRECPHVNDQTHDIYDPENHLDYRNKVLQEVLVRVTEGKLNLHQVCRAVVILGKMEVDKGFSFSKDFIDKFWVGILDRNDEINAVNIVEVLRTVKYFKKSSRLVLNLVERKMVTLWWKMSTETVAEICSVLISSDGPIISTAEKMTHGVNSWQVSTRLLMTLSKCTNLNLHKVSETQLATIVKAMHTLNFCDGAMEQALDKYMKAKCLKITDPQLVANIMDFARKFRLRSSSLLQASSEFLVKHNASNLSTPQFTSILKPFGELDFQPPQGPRFWEVVENYLSERFIQFPPNDMVEVLLSCVYLMKYPINFVDRTFSPYFLDRLHTSEPDFIRLQQHRSNLKLLNTAMTVECRNKYAGPLLPKDFSGRTIFIDGRILRIAPVLKETLMGICGDVSFDLSLILPHLPLNPIFSADVFITSPRVQSDTERNAILRSHINSYWNYSAPPSLPKSYEFTAVLVGIPEHYSADGKHLIGIQSLRRRLLKALGLKVVNVSYQKLAEAKGDFHGLAEYVEEQLQNAS